LIDVTPKNIDEIMVAARLYKKHQKDRADLQRLKGGKVKFAHDGFIISVTPRDELVQVKEKK